MGIKLNNDVVVTKVFNNSIVLVKSKGKEKILFSKGIGFGKKFGDKILKNTEVDKLFSIEDKNNIINFNKIVDRVDTEFFVFCEEIIYKISEDLNEELSENIHIGLIDHLYFAIKRLQNGEEIKNPFVVEIETLYPKAFVLAAEAGKKIGEKFNVKVPKGEIGFIALHIHSAINDKSLSHTIKYSYLSNLIVKNVEENLNIKIDKKSLDYARFLTHIRFAIERLLTNKFIKNDLASIIKEKYKKSYEVAEGISEILEEELGTAISSDEIAYLAMHIERFKLSL